ncbi:MAG: twin-arginine translocase TatA/TatE family subunit [Acidobacteria bacterium]|nr:twin-arginine translocase TatA/TatE family subunit [Acidobacteriota bacterium]
MLFFLPESPILLIVVIGAAILLFGAGRLPQLAKSIGQSKRAFKEGLREGEMEEDWVDKPRDNTVQPPQISSTATKPLSEMTDAELEAEMARRKQG